MRHPSIDIVRVQDVGLYSASDQDVLEWAAQANRILLTHDVATVPRFAYERVQSGVYMLGVIVVPHDLPVGRVIYDVTIMWEYSLDGEWNDRVIHLPIT